MRNKEEETFSFSLCILHQLKFYPPNNAQLISNLCSEVFVTYLGSLEFLLSQNSCGIFFLQHILHLQVLS